MKKQPTIDIEIMHGPILTVWNAIGYDSLAEGSIPNISAIEGCIDANRLTMFCRGEAGKRAEAELDRAIKAHGYPKVLRALARAITLET